MINSMTAFARQESTLRQVLLTWEVRTVNHRYLDINLRLPDELRRLDPLVRKTIGEQISRGRVDAYLKLDHVPDAEGVMEIDQGALNSLKSLLEQVKTSFPDAQAARIMDILRWPGILSCHTTDNQILDQAATRTLHETLNELTENRLREGKRLGEILSHKVDQCLSRVEELDRNMPDIQNLAKEKMQSKIKEFADSLDPERMAQEIAVLLTKSDVSEEVDRLRTHLDEVYRLLKSNKPVGRSLDFLMQELNREANTIGSKSVDEKMTNASIELKVSIDQMREQVQNIE